MKLPFLSSILSLIAVMTAANVAMEKPRELTICDTFDACYLIDIRTRLQYKLTAGIMNTFIIDPANDRGYSVRCDVSSNDGAESHFIKFFYDGIVQDEFGLPRFMNGDSLFGEYINPVPYLSKCGLKKFNIEGHVWSNICFKEDFMINLLDPDGTCRTPTNAPVNPPTNTPILSPTNAPALPPTNAPEKPSTFAPINPQTNAPILPPTHAPINPPTDAPILPPTNAPFKPTNMPVEPPTNTPSNPPTNDPVNPETNAPVTPPTNAPVNPPTDAPVDPPTNAPINPPTNTPVEPPTTSPVTPPTSAPLNPPTDAPILPPTNAPVNPPTDAPVSPPTNAPVKPPTRDICETFDACYLVDIRTRMQFKLSGRDTFLIDPANDRGYSVRCDIIGNVVSESHYIQFFYDGIEQNEFGLPRYMNGDSLFGEIINPVPYLTKCGLKQFAIEGRILTNVCFYKDFVINFLDTDGTCNPPAPVKPPSRAPVKPPTRAPVKAPIRTPVKPPTRSPVKPPTRAPIKPPTRAPLKPPTRSPVKPPTRAPVKPPTRAPVKPPVRVPVKPPTCAPVKPVPVPVPTSKCVLPKEAFNFSIMSRGDATIAAHNMYKGIAVGGTLYDGSPHEHGAIDRTVSYVKYLDDNTRFNFNGGLALGKTVPQSVYDHFAYLATNAVSAKYSNGYQVFVLHRGGTYDLFDFVPEGQGENNGKTLVIFNTSEDVTLTSTHSLRQFGPSVIAPFSKVIVLGVAGYVDGFVVAKCLVTSGPQASWLQFHGDAYTGPLTCK